MKEFLKQKQKKKINGCSYLQTSRYSVLLWVGHERGTGIYSARIILKIVVSEVSLKSSCSETAWCDKSCSLMNKISAE